MLKSCRICKKKYYGKGALGGEQFCGECEEKKEQYYMAIFNHLRDNPNCTINEIQQATGAEYQLIYHLVSSGCFSRGAPVCSQCRKPLESSKSRLCAECTQKLSREMQSKLQERAKTEIQKVVKVDDTGKSQSRYGLSR